MPPQPWRAPVEPSPAEAAVMRRIKRAKLFVFLRESRHEIFDEGFQEELGTTLYGDSRRGQPPVPPAKLALATILQAYTGASDEEAIEAMVMDRRWQLVFGLPGGRGAALLQGHPGGLPQEANRARDGPAAGRTHGGSCG